MVNLQSLQNEMEAVTFQAQQLVIYTIRAALGKSPQLARVTLTSEGFAFQWDANKYTSSNDIFHPSTPRPVVDLMCELNEIESIIECKAAKFMKPIEIAQDGMKYLG